MFHSQTPAFIAPDDVYKTAKQLKQPNFSNITWVFNVSKNSSHFVRVHFCDITGSSPGALNFTLHIYGKFSKPIKAMSVNVAE